MKSKWLLISLVLSMVLVFSIGCGTQDTTTTTTTTAAGETTAPADTTEDPGTTEPGEPLRIAWWGSQVRHDITLEVIDMYTEKTGQEFEPDFLGFDDYFSKLNTQVAAGDVPDIFQLGGNFPTYIDHIEFLNPFIANGMIDTSDIDDSFIGITTYNGNTVGISLGTNSRAMAYNPRLFDEAGVPQPHLDWTWEDWENAVMTIHEELGIFGSSALSEHEVLTGWIDQFDVGQSFYLKPDRLALDYTDDEYVIELFSMFKRVTDAGAFPNPAQIAEITDIEGDFIVRGESAMLWIASNQFVALMASAQDELALAPPPRRFSGGPTSWNIISSQMFSMYNGSDNQDAAARFMSYFVNDVDANLVLRGERGVPINGTVREILGEELGGVDTMIMQYLSDIGPEASVGIVLNSPVQAEIEDIYVSLIEEVVYGVTTPEDAAVQLRQRAEEVLSRIN